MNEHFQDGIENKAKLKYFKCYKISVETAKYVSANLSRTQGSLLAKTRHCVSTQCIPRRDMVEA